MKLKRRLQVKENLFIHMVRSGFHHKKERRRNRRLSLELSGGDTGISSLQVQPVRQTVWQ